MNVILFIVLIILIIIVIIFYKQSFKGGLFYNKKILYECNSEKNEYKYIIYGQNLAYQYYTGDAFNKVINIFNCDYPYGDYMGQLTFLIKVLFYRSRSSQPLFSDRKIFTISLDVSPCKNLGDLWSRIPVDGILYYIFRKYFGAEYQQIMQILRDEIQSQLQQNNSQISLHLIGKFKEEQRNDIFNKVMDPNFETDWVNIYGSDFRLLIQGQKQTFKRNFIFQIQFKNLLKTQMIKQLYEDFVQQQSTSQQLIPNKILHKLFIEQYENEIYDIVETDQFKEEWKQIYENNFDDIMQKKQNVYLEKFIFGQIFDQLFQTQPIQYLYETFKQQEQRQLLMDIPFNALTQQNSTQVKQLSNYVLQSMKKDIEVSKEQYIEFICSFENDQMDLFLQKYDNKIFKKIKESIDYLVQEGPIWKDIIMFILCYKLKYVSEVWGDFPKIQNFVHEELLTSYNQIIGQAHELYQQLKDDPAYISTDYLRYNLETSDNFQQDLEQNYEKYPLTTPIHLLYARFYLVRNDPYPDIPMTILGVSRCVEQSLYQLMFVIITDVQTLMIKYRFGGIKFLQVLGLQPGQRINELDHQELVEKFVNSLNKNDPLYFPERRPDMDASMEVVKKVLNEYMFLQNDQYINIQYYSIKQLLERLFEDAEVEVIGDEYSTNIRQNVEIYIQLTHDKNYTLIINNKQHAQFDKDENEQDTLHYVDYLIDKLYFNDHYQKGFFDMQLFYEMAIQAFTHQECFSDEAYTRFISEIYIPQSFLQSIHNKIQNFLNQHGQINTGRKYLQLKNKLGMDPFNEYETLYPQQQP